MSIQKKSLISALKTAKKANVASAGAHDVDSKGAKVDSMRIQHPRAAIVSAKNFAAKAPVVSAKNIVAKSPTHSFKGVSAKSLKMTSNKSVSQSLKNIQ
jgi:hypothetical protein